ncbi:MAG TPA: twin-arginine translocase TatA/TatE family subunit [Vicinamibacterales bacterium]|nr:twin-arginine translocase TatA/TatE family subunit [Vicinamibacterales bacterium]
MFGSIGAGEVLMILIIALIVFGPRKLPEMGKALGRGLNEFKKASSDLRSSLEAEIRIEHEQEKLQQQAQAAARTPSLPSPAADATPPAGQGEGGSPVRPAEQRS